jgi:hypothetical protein
MTDQQQKIDNDEISLKELIQKIQEWVAYLKTQWKLIISIAALGGIIGFVYASFQKPTYKAVTTFVLEEDKGGGGAMNLASSFGFDLGGGGGGVFSGSNFIELMKSQLLIEKTLLNSVVVDNDTTSILEYYFKVNHLESNWNKEIQKKFIDQKIDRKNFTRSENTLLYNVYADLSSSKKISIGQKDKKNSILILEVNSEDELFSKLFCEQLIKEVSYFYTETKSKKARINFEILQKQADSIRLVLNNAIDGVASSIDNVYNLNPSLVRKRTPSSKRQIEVQSSSAILGQLETQLELAKVSLRKETPLIQIIDEPRLPLFVKRINKTNSMFIGLLLSITFVSISLIVYKETKKNIN